MNLHEGGENNIFTSLNRLTHSSFLYEEADRTKTTPKN